MVKWANTQQPFLECLIELNIKASLGLKLGKNDKTNIESVV